MEIRHFVFGKFNATLPDYGLRVIDETSEKANLVHEYNKIGEFFLSNFRTAFYTHFPSANPEIIFRHNDQYIFARFFPPFQEENGRDIHSLFHAFVFNKEELAAINYCPWRLRKKFIKSYNPTEIIGYDDTDWLTKEDCTVKDYSVRSIDISVSPGVTENSFYKSFSPYYTIVNNRPDEILTGLSIPLRLALFSSGIILNCTGDTLLNLYDKRLHFIFLAEQPVVAVPGHFTSLNENNLKQLEPVIETVVKEKEKIISPVSKPIGPLQPEPIVETPINILAPSFIKVLKLEDKISISWENHNDFAVKTIIERTTSSAENFIELHNGFETAGKKQGIYIDDTAEKGNEYKYRLSFFHPAKTSAKSVFSVSSEIKTSPNSIDHKLIQLSINNGNPDKLKIDLLWTVPDNSYNVVYDIERIHTDQENKSSKTKIAENLTGNSYQDIETEEGISYRYIIKTVVADRTESSLAVETNPIKIPVPVSSVIVEDIQDEKTAKNITGNTYEEDLKPFTKDIHNEAAKNVTKDIQDEVVINDPQKIIRDIYKGKLQDNLNDKILPRPGNGIYQNPENSYVQPVNKKNNRKALYAIAAICLITICVSSIFYHFRNNKISSDDTKTSSKNDENNAKQSDNDPSKKYQTNNTNRENKNLNPDLSQKSDVPSIENIKTDGIFVGETYLLRIKNPVVNGYWISRDTQNAVIDSNGLVKGKKKGGARLSYKFDFNGNEISLPTSINVKDRPFSLADILPKNNIIIKVGNSFQLTNSTPNGEWYSTNSKIVSVAQNGLIKAEGKGFATIYYEVNGQKKEKRVTVNERDNNTAKDTTQSQQLNN